MTERKYSNDYVQDILRIISSEHTLEEKTNLLDEYHDKDIAEAFELLPKKDYLPLLVILKIQKIIFRTLDIKSTQCFLIRWT